MHWVQCTELHKLNDLESIKIIFKCMKNWHHCLIQNLSNAEVADFKPPKNRLPVGILKFRKNVLVQKVLDYSKLKQSRIVLYFHYLIQLTPGLGLKENPNSLWVTILFTDMAFNSTYSVFSVSVLLSLVLIHSRSSVWVPLVM